VAFRSGTFSSFVFRFSLAERKTKYTEIGKYLAAAGYSEDSATESHDVTKVASINRRCR
jgi:hypothetical protein